MSAAATIRSSCGRLERVKRQIYRLVASSAALSTAAVSGCHRWLHHRSLGFVQVPAVEVERSLGCRAGQGVYQSSDPAAARGSHPTRRHGDRACLCAAGATRRVVSQFESLWVTFPAACGVSPGHDQRLRQEARPRLPEATRELPPGSLVKYPAACGGGPLFFLLLPSTIFVGY